MGEESADQIMNGKHFSNAMKIHHAVVEALTRKKKDSFIEWLKKRSHNNILQTFMSSKELKKLQEEPTNESFKSCELAITWIINLFEEFEQIIPNTGNSPIAAFWQSYLEMFELLLQFQKSINSGNWELHPDSCEMLLLWFHAYDHHNYARHFSYYWASQQRLPVTHPSLYNESVNENFAINITQGRFNRISPDQAIVQTINRDQKAPGTISITLILVSRLSALTAKVYVREREHLILQIAPLNV